jgi:CDP-glucose 4,6-dehydratase
VEGVVKMDLAFWKGRRVFLTGHTGFKGTYLARMLAAAGAEVTGYALAPAGSPAVFALSGTEGLVRRHRIGDVGDFAALKAAFDESRPEVVFHLAAQPIVRESYLSPRETYATNLMGTVNLLECVRLGGDVRSVVNVTTDKVYLNDESAAGFREDDRLDGYDPYSNSKSCSELASGAYRRSFFAASGVALSTARAGNVIGGGDFAPDRIIPDCVRAVAAGETVKVRNPRSVRPYQHVLEPLAMYLKIAEAQYADPGMAGAWNIGPDECDSISTAELADMFCRAWGGSAAWEDVSAPGAPHEAGTLRLDNSRIRTVFGWRPRWTLEKAVRRACEVYRAWLGGGDVGAEIDRQTAEFFDGQEF